MKVTAGLEHKGWHECTQPRIPCIFMTILIFTNDIQPHNITHITLITKKQQVNMNALMEVIMFAFFAATFGRFLDWMLDRAQRRVEDEPVTYVTICIHYFIVVDLPEPEAPNQSPAETD
ncbi:e0fa097f-7afe-4444-9826-8a50b0b74b5f-CDS [Sclerotinia trifoliorum]|uniref:E0fa097f-7afe-4444-9826-8a50b0b74b5f-CDS n=1 Tax=Sclerotinia trifoliorum TaxID=28548 RepID=A0A8H2ZUN6_9HELO|nr:e0fa097f-7afe-4444-9826-8a50b0b74b5f-CDS [Sclerotinia trifoliorum]